MSSELWPAFIVQQLKDSFAPRLEEPLTRNPPDVEGLREELTLFAGLNNVFDVEPPLAPSGSGNGNFILFDPSGRTWKLGVRASF